MSSHSKLHAWSALGLAAVAACSVAPVTYQPLGDLAFRVGGTVTGLAGTLTLGNGGDTLAITADGAFTLPTALATGEAYDVHVVTRPTSPSQTCAVSQGQGTVGTSDVADVAVTCTTDRFTVGGRVTGLTGSVVVQLGDGAPLTLAADGPFTFPSPIESNAAYAVTIVSQPLRAACTLDHASGTIGTDAVSDVVITCAPVSWAPALFPLAIANTQVGVGDLDLDARGDLLATTTGSGSNAVVRVDHVTGEITPVASQLGALGFLLGVAYRPANDTIYTADASGVVYAIAGNGAVTPLTTVTGADAIAIAPATFGSFGGFLIIATSQASVVAVDPADGAITPITTAAGATSDLAFAPDGTLYLAGGATIRTLTATGTVTPFAGNFNSADGITITPDGGRMFIADSGVDQVIQVTIPGAQVTAFAPADIDDGFFVGGILAAPGNTLIVMTGETALTLRGFTY